jgi:hypothetical protein
MRRSHNARDDLSAVDVRPCLEARITSHDSPATSRESQIINHYSPISTHESRNF